MFHASTPPDEEYLTALFVLNEDNEVEVLVIPLVLLPLGSVVARQNSISQSAAIVCQTNGVLI